MGLASALSTALTGLNAAETTIDVVGNNLANSNTVGFKASKVTFATQFLQTQSLGSAPTSDNGGTNPRQIGLGTMVADITPDFSQGTIQISSAPTDMAIQGEGFFIVQGESNERLYTRNGVFKMNSESELVTVTGHRLLGYGVDDNYQIQTTNLVPLTIPLGAAAVAEATENVYLEGTLSPTGDLADTSEIIQTGTLSDLAWDYPAAPLDAAACDQLGPPTAPLVVTKPGGAGPLTDNRTYYYKLVYADRPFDLTDPLATEGVASAYIQVDLAVGEQNVQIDNWQAFAAPPAGEGSYPYVRFYRTTAQVFGGVADPDALTYYFVGEQDFSTPPFNDTVPDAAVNPAETLDVTQAGALPSGSYEYYVTWYNPGQNVESRPVKVTNAINVSGGRIHLTNLPAHVGTQYSRTRIYRNLSTDTTDFRLLAEINNVDGTSTYTDYKTDAELGSTQLDLDGPKIRENTLLTNVVRRDGDVYERVFPINVGETATLQFTGRKGGRTLATKELTITDTTTVLNLMDFMEEAMGIQIPPGLDSSHPIPADSVTGWNPGGRVNTAEGRIMMVANTGVGNAIDVGLSGMILVHEDNSIENIDLPWSSYQSAVGESAVTDFIVYDTLGIPIAVRLTAVLESRTSTATTYRWYADSPDNDPATGVKIAVGTGLIQFDGEGNFVAATEETVSIDRRNVSSASPLEFELDFRQISGLATDNSTLAVSRQDGSGPGVLTSFIVGEDGRIRGVFSNGMTRDLGQIRLARFGNPSGLEQRGENMFAAGVNSGLPVEGNPSEQGIGSIIAGAQELSNTDIGGDLIDLILASTMYRSNTRVITTAQQMLDELLSLRR